MVDRQDMLDFIFRHAPEDQRTVLANGERAVVVPGSDIGSIVKAKLCPLFLLPDHVVEERYEATKRRLEVVRDGWQNERIVA